MPFAVVLCDAKLRSTGSWRVDATPVACRVDVEDDVVLAAHLPSLDIRMTPISLLTKHRDQDVWRTPPELVEVEQAVLASRQVTSKPGARARASCEPLGGLDGDQVLASRLVELRRTLDGKVVRLGGARRPDDLARIGADQGGDLLARLLDRRFRLPAPGVAARRRVAEVLAQPRDHGVDDALVDRRRRAVVHVDREMRGHVHGGRLTSRKPPPARTPSSAR